MNKEKEWIEIALKDIEASILLYKSGLFGQSYFYFQQASEKANKVLWLLDGQIKQEEVKDISHKQLLIPRKVVVKQIENVDNFTLIENIFPELSTNPLIKNLKERDLGAYKNSLNEKKKFIDRFRHSKALDFESCDLEKELILLNELKDYKGSSNWFNNLKIVLRENKEWVENFKENNRGKNNLLLEVINYYESLGLRGFIAFLNKYLSLIYMLSYVSGTLSICGFLTDKHNQITRYPDVNEKVHPVSFYNQSLNVVKYQLEFIEHLNNSLKLLLKTYCQN